MQLRRKFGWLALIYVLSLSVNLLMSAWCIIVYFQSAFLDFETDLGHEQQVEQARSAIRGQGALLEQARDPRELAGEYAEFEQNLSISLAQLQYESRVEPLTPLWPGITALLAEKQAVARRRLQSASPITAEDRRSFVELDDLLKKASGELGLQRQHNVDRAANIQQRVVSILIVNTACGAFLCTLGLIFVRRWVIQPVADLRAATQQLSQGDFSYRIQPRSSDELGQLAGEVNQMASTIVDMQKKMVEQERLAAAGEMVTRLAHNIRNPLAGIRGLAEATMSRLKHVGPASSRSDRQDAGSTNDPETANCQQRIIDTIDRFEKWLRDLQQSVSPLSLNLKRVRVQELIDGVITALRPMLDRRRIQVRTEVDPHMSEVLIDNLHFEQALVALLTNAVQASQPGQTVRIKVRPLAESPGRWQIDVEDDGTGIPRELVDRIFEPYFTTKPDGNGVGLAMASKVMKIHGGQLTVESQAGKGSRFAATLPGLCESV